MKIMENAIAIKGKGGKRRVLDFSYRLEALAEIKDPIPRLTELSKGLDWRK